MSPMSIGQAKRPRWLLVLTGVAAWAMVAALLILEVAPATPTSVRGWVLLLVVGPPAYVASEFVMERMFNPKLSARISSAKFSFARIAVALVLMLLLLAPF